MKSVIGLITYLFVAAVLAFCLGCDEKAADTKAPAETMAQAQQQQQTETTAPAEARETKRAHEGPAPKIVIENATFDFGSIDPDSRHTGQFEFTNEGQGQLEIKRIQSTCGCTVPKLEKNTYGPGESGTVTFKYHAGTRSGSARKHLYILSNDPENPRAQLTIKADITEKISYEPKRFVLKLNEENAGLGEIKIKSLDGREFAISRLRVRPECIDVDYDPTVEAKEFVLQPTVDMEKVPKNGNGRIIFTLTHPSQKTVSIPFSVLPPFKTDPSTLIALNVQRGKPVRKTLYVLSNYQEDFEVKSVSTANDAITIVSEEKLGDKYKIVLDITPPSNLGDRRHFTSKLKIVFEDGEELLVNCVGSVRSKS